jgi:branched-chain amino acid transport system substrate-binding protein
MKDGVELYLSKINQDGGIRGKKIKLHVLDDTYEPLTADRNMKSLSENQDILAIIGNVGTPTARVTVPIANKEKILLFGAFTGAGLLRLEPPDRYVINYRASYKQETAFMISSLLDSGVQVDEIAVFTQEDSYGDAGFIGVMEELKRRNIDKSLLINIKHGRYTRNTTKVSLALNKILSSQKKPKAIIMVGAYQPCAEFIKMAKEKGLTNTLFMNVSFVGSIPLLNALGENSENVIVTQVVPHYNSDLPIVKEYRDEAKKIGLDIGFVSLEGYISAKIFVTALKSISGDINRESIIDAIENMKDIDIGIGFMIDYSKTNHQASNQIWPTIIEDNQYIRYENNQ